MDYKIKKTDKADSTVEIEVNVSYDEVKSRLEKSKKALIKNVEVDGFRKGNVPEDIALKQIGSDKIEKHAAEMVIDELFPHILQKEDLRIIGYPSISVEKLNQKEGLIFKAFFAIYPEVALPDYKKIAKDIKIENVEVTKDDLEKTYQSILQMHNQSQHNHKEGEKCDHKDKTEIDDEVAKSIGFKDKKDLESKIQDDIKKHKEWEAKAKNREAILEAILKETNFEVPALLWEAEKEKMIAQMKDDLISQGMKWDDYLKQIGKDEVQFRDSLTEEAKKRAKIEVILKEIAKKEELKADAKELEKQLQSAIQVYKDADQENLKLYLENILINESVLKFLEK